MFHTKGRGRKCRHAEHVFERHKVCVKDARNVNFRKVVPLLDSPANDINNI